MNDNWLKPALLGVDRPQTIAAEGALGEALASLAAQEDAALAYSQQVGVLAACRRAALRLAAPVTTASPVQDDPLILPAGHVWAPLLKDLFVGGQPPQWTKRLRYEACLQLAVHGRNLPIAVLPHALEAGARFSPLRAGLRPVLGARGRWLATYNADWAYASQLEDETDETENLERVWTEGTADSRLIAFRQLRAHDAESARQRLQATLKELSARERVDFVSALQPQLSVADVPLLQPLLRDRSREVRMLVGPMLTQLASTAHAQYVQAQMLGLLQQQRGGLLRRLNWVLEAPSAPDPGWADAGIDGKRPNNDMLGERAWWLYQLARQLPLPWWCHTLERDPEQVLAWARTTDWYDALLRAWMERADASTPEWVEALIGVEQLRAHLTELLALLPVAQRERHWPGSVKALQQQQLLGEVLGSTGLGQTLSAAYSQQLADGMDALFAEDGSRYDYHLREPLLELLAILHPSVLYRVLLADPSQAASAAALDCVQQGRQLLSLRQVLHSSL